METAVLFEDESGQTVRLPPATISPASASASAASATP